MEAKPKNDNLLALKVMRLTRPTLVSPTIVTCDSSDLPQNTLNNDLKNDCTALQNMEALAVGQFMILPQSFGNLYLGEIFSCYLCVHNSSNQTVKDVNVKADLKTNKQLIQLSGQNSDPKELAPNCTIDEVIHHEIKEIGTYILTCEITYTPTVDTTIPQSFRKFFKFQVVKPLDIKTKFFFNEMTMDIYHEAQIQNLTAGPICLEKVTLETSNLFTAKALHEDDNGDPIFGKVNVLDSNQIRQYMYQMKPQPSIINDFKVLNNVTNYGKLDIVWRSNLGERGRLQTSQLLREPTDPGCLKVLLKNVPDMIHLEEPVDFKCHIINVSERKMDLMLGLQSNSAIAWCGTSDVMVGTLASGDSVVLPLRLIPLEMGLVNISGLQLTDTLLKQVFEYDHLAQIFVIQEKS